MTPLVEDDDSLNYNDDLAPNREVGVKFFVDAATASSQQLVEMRVQCARALYASEGSNVAGYDEDPLAVPGARARVGTSPGYFVIEVRGQGETLRAIRERASALRAAKAPSATAPVGNVRPSGVAFSDD